MFLNNNKTQKSSLNFITNTLIHRPITTTNKDNYFRKIKKLIKKDHCSFITNPIK